MRKKICDVGYINKVKDNLLNVKDKTLLPLYEDLRSSDCIICGGSGRSLYSINTAASQLATMKDYKTVITSEDPGFPGRNMYDAAPKLEKKYGKIMLLINSGSGESGDPKTLVQDLERYINDTHSENFSMGLITSKLNSSIAKIVRKNGHVVKIEGRSESFPSSEYSETGIMGDIFELGSLSLLQMMSEAIFKKLPVEGVLELLEEELPILGEIVDKNLSSEAYTSSLDILERRSDVFLGGSGTANAVTKMTAIRLFHIKKFLGDNVYIARGVNTPRPRAGDLQILVSYTGETKSVLDWGKVFRRLGGVVLSFTGQKSTPLETISDHRIVLEEVTKLGQPRRFYMRVAYVLSPFPVKLTERLREKGLRLAEYVLDWYHSVTE